MMFADQTDIAEARQIIDHARDDGVNFIDTADVYTRGTSEAMVGELIGGTRHDWVLASKVGNQMSDRPNESRYSRDLDAARACEASLKRLRHRSVDVYYLHRDYDDLDLEEPLLAIDTLLRDGKIRYWGAVQLPRLADRRGGAPRARRLGIAEPAVCQPYYNLLNRQPEVEVLPACLQHGIGVVPYSPIARGVLAAKYAPGAKPEPGTPRRPRRRADDADRVPRGIAARRADPEGALREEGRRAVAVRGRLGDWRTAR